MNRFNKGFFRTTFLTMAMLSAAQVCQASTSVDFAYATADFETDFYGLQNMSDENTVVYCATKFDAADLAPYAGNFISSLTVYSPSDDVCNPQPDVEVFIYEGSLAGNPLYKQRAVLSEEQKAANAIKLDKPVEIVDGRDYYVGYRLQMPWAPFYYIPVDLNIAAPERCISAIMHSDAYPMEWEKIGREYGNLCLGLTITGDKLPDNWAVITQADFPPYLAPSASGSIEMMVENKGVAPINALKLSTVLPDGRTVESNATLAKPIAEATTAKVVFEGLKFDSDGCYEVSSVISKVNGKDARANDPAKGMVLVYDGGFQRQIVIEEAGGAWCQWCPAGIVMLENIRKDYPENFHCISVHQGDQLDLPAYYPFLKKYFSYFPASITNRAVQYDPATGHSVEFTREFIKGLYDRYMSYPAVGEVRFSFVPTPDGKKVRISSEVEFALDIERQYQLSFVLTEDNVGPYLQTNAYHTGDYGEMGGWESMDMQAECRYNDVAREILGFPGIEDSLPASIKKGQKYNYNCELPLARLTGSDWRVIALLTDAETGEIVNSAEVLSDTYSYSGINDVMDDSVNGATKVYTLDGRLVPTPVNGSLPQGVYIIRTGSQTRKVMVR